MRPPRQRDDDDRHALLPRLNRALGQLNPLLLAIAIGLAVLDFTCLASMWLPTNGLTVCALPETGAPQPK